MFGQSSTSTIIERDSLSDSKVLALILAEHQKLSIENPLLKDQIKNLEELNLLFEKSDSIQNSEIQILQEKISFDEKKIKKLESSRKSIIGGSCVGGIVLFILGLIL